jgi:DoxX-like family
VSNQARVVRRTIMQTKTELETTPNANLPSRKRHALLWTIQGVLAALFLFAGGMKLALPAAELTQQGPLPAAFLRFIGVAEVLGALGLILPGLLRIRPGLTPLAAAGLVLIMTGATVLTLVIGPATAAVFPLVVGLLAAYVVHGRWQRTPRQAGHSRAADPGLQPVH